MSWWTRKPRASETGDLTRPVKEAPLSFFAEIDPATRIVQRVIVAEQDFIDSGAVGDPANWIRTDPRLQDYAGIGDVYDPARRTFVKQSGKE